MQKHIYSVDEIRRIIFPIAEKYHLPAVYLFGSYARGEATADSDIDFIVDTSQTELKSLFSLGALYIDFEEALHKKIDLITEQSLHQYTTRESDHVFRKNVQRERKRIYGTI